MTKKALLPYYWKVVGVDETWAEYCVYANDFSEAGKRAAEVYWPKIERRVKNIFGYEESLLIHLRCVKTSEEQRVKILVRVMTIIEGVSEIKKIKAYCDFCGRPYFSGELIFPETKAKRDLLGGLCQECYENIFERASLHNENWEAFKMYKNTSKYWEKRLK